MPVGDSLTTLTRDARANILLAFEDLGGVQRLVEWANDPDHPENLGDFYTKIFTKVIPREAKVEHTGKNGGSITFAWEDATVIPTNQPPVKMLPTGDEPEEVIWGAREEASDGRTE